jgi:hypothetical protein
VSICIFYQLFVFVCGYNQYHSDKRVHRTSASGSATGVNTPPRTEANTDDVRVGDRTMPRAEFDDAKKYFDLFHNALSIKYPQGGYSIMYNEVTGMCTALGRKSAETYKFEFKRDTIKNHYCTFRILGDDFENYLAQVRSQGGAPNYTAAG